MRKSLKQRIAALVVLTISLSSFATPAGAWGSATWKSDDCSGYSVRANVNNLHGANTMTWIGGSISVAFRGGGHVNLAGKSSSSTNVVRTFADHVVYEAYSVSGAQHKCGGITKNT